MPESLLADRPRERLLGTGSAVLTNVELVTLLLGSGTSSYSSVAVAQRLLSRFGSLRRLATRDPREWMEQSGVGPARAGRLGAAFEIGRRVASEPLGPAAFVRGPADVARLMAPHLRDLAHEEFRVLLLNTAGAVIGDHLVSRGGLSASVVEPRSVFRLAILESAAAVVCVHNHPSGNPEPSREDVHVTRQLEAAGKVVGIPLRDHVIVAGDSFTSLVERGVL